MFFPHFIAKEEREGRSKRKCEGSGSIDRSVDQGSTSTEFCIRLGSIEVRESDGDLLEFESGRSDPSDDRSTQFRRADDDDDGDDDDQQHDVVFERQQRILGGERESEPGEGPDAAQP